MTHGWGTCSAAAQNKYLANCKNVCLYGGKLLLWAIIAGTMFIYWGNLNHMRQHKMYQFKYKGGRCCYKQNIQKKDVGIHHGTSRGCLLLHSVGMCTFFRDALRLGLCRVELRRKDAKDRWKYSTWKQQTVLEHAWANMEKWRNVANFSSVLTLLWNCFKMHPSHIPPSKIEN